VNVPSQAAGSKLAEERAALRRVATLVARGVPPEEAFEAVATEVGRLFLVDVVNIARYESDGMMTLVASAGNRFPVGHQYPLGGKNVSTRVFETGRPARIDSYADATGPVADDIRDRGVRSAVETPIIVEGRLWGVMGLASTQEQPLPAETEERLALFTELAATAISNVQARTEVAASRERIAAATDEERRRVVRDLHDGAQQRLVHTILTLKLAQRASQNEDEDLPALLTEALTSAEHAMAELRELAQGILPKVLTHGGLRGSGGAGLADAGACRDRRIGGPAPRRSRGNRLLRRRRGAHQRRQARSRRIGRGDGTDRGRHARRRGAR
jgi:GAF domain-containing protein